MDNELIEKILYAQMIDRLVITENEIVIIEDCIKHFEKNNNEYTLNWKEEINNLKIKLKNRNQLNVDNLNSIMWILKKYKHNEILKNIINRGNKIETIYI